MVGKAQMPAPKGRRACPVKQRYAGRVKTNAPLASLRRNFVIATVPIFLRQV